MIGDTLRFEEKRQGEAISAYRTAIKLKPDYLIAYKQLAIILEQTNDEKGLEEVFKKCMELDPLKMVGRFELGRKLVKQGRLAEARELWTGKTTAVDNTIPSFIEVLERAENLNRITEALKANPKNPELLVQMGLAVMEGEPWIRDGRQEKALVYFNQALKLKPGFARAQYGICKAYIEIAAILPAKKKIADQEMIKLRMLDKARADELEQYRKGHIGGIPGGIVGSPVDLNK